MVQTLENLRQSSKTSYQNCIRCGGFLVVWPEYCDYINETSSPREPVTLGLKSLGSEHDIGSLNRPHIQML